MVLDAEIARSLGEIEASIKNIAGQLALLPCANNTKRLIQIEQSLQDREKFEKEKKELEKEFKGETKYSEEKTFKMDARTISILSVIMIGINLVSTVLLNLLKR